MNKTLIRLVAVLAALVLSVSACSKKTEVGKGVGTGEGGEGEARGAIRNTTTTTAPTTSTAPTTTAKPGATTAKPTTTTTARPTTTKPTIKALEISINGDNSGTSQFDPSQGLTCKGGLVRFTNKDSVPRSVESAKAGVFATPPIPPGGTAEIKATFPAGAYNFTDGTRPYAQGQLQVSNC